MTPDRYNGLNVGDVVRVLDPDGYLVEFAKKIRDRDATVVNLWIPQGGTSGYATLRFHKRGNRGKEFNETMRTAALVKKDTHG